MNRSDLLLGRPAHLLLAGTYPHSVQYEIANNYHTVIQELCAVGEGARSLESVKHDCCDQQQQNYFVDLGEPVYSDYLIEPNEFIFGYLEVRSPTNG